MRNKLLIFTGQQFLFMALIGYALFVASCFLVNPFQSEASLYESPVFATASEARKYVGTPLPDEAVNTQLASYREWIAAEDYLRFEAPVEVCRQHAAKMLPKQSLLNSMYSRVTTLSPFPKSPHFKDLSWYDLGVAKSVVCAREGHISIFVDLDRGVFYYHYTD